MNDLDNEQEPRPRHLESVGAGTPKITLGDLSEANDNLVITDEGKKVLEAFGLTRETAIRLTLGLGRDRSTLVLPFLDGTRIAGFVRWGSQEPRARPYQGLRATFNSASLKNAPERIYLCPSALDAALVSQQLGVDAAVASSHVGPLMDDQVEAMKGAREIVLVSHGGRDAFDLARQLGPERTVVAKIPEPTCLESIRKHGPGALDSAVMAAEPYRMPGVLTVQEGFERLREKMLFGVEDETFVDFPQETMNEVGGKISEGDVVTLMAKRKIGKTSASMGFCLHNALQGRGSLLVELEMNEESTLRRTAQIVLSARKEEVDIDRMGEASQVMSQVPWYYWICGDLRGRERFDEWLEKLRYAVRQHGIRLIVFDHFHLLMRGCNNMEADGAAMSGKFKQFAVAERVAFMILLQPKRTKEQTTFDDGKYTSALEQDADLALTLNRDEIKTEMPDPTTRVRRGIYHPLTRVSALGRNAAGGIGWLMFEENYFRFRELSDQEFKDLRP